MRIRTLVPLLALASAVSCVRDPNEIKEKYVQNGDKYFAHEKYRQASIMYRSALRRDAKYAPAYYHLALAQLKLDEAGEALGPLRRAVELLPDGPDRLDAKAKLVDIYLYYLESVQRDKDLKAESQRLAAELVDSGVGAYDGHRLAARLAMLDVRDAERRGIPDRVAEYLQIAIGEYRQADAVRPFQTEVVVPLARSLISHKESKVAEQTYLALLDHDTANLPVYGELYSLYVRQNRLADAESILKRGIGNNPKSLVLLGNLASHYHGTGRDQEALKTIEQLKVLGLGTPHIHQNIGSLYMKLGRTDEAIRQYEAGIQAEPKEKNYYRKRIAETLMAIRKHAEAGRILESVLKDDPKDAEARLLLGSNFLQSGDINNAVTGLLAAVQSDQLNPLARYLLGSVLTEQGQYALAIPELQKAIRFSPDYLEPRLKLAQVQILLDQNEGAIKTSQNILEDVDGRNVTAMLLRGVALRNLNRLDEARAAMASVLKLQPNSPDALLQLGELSVRAENYTEAERIFRKVYEQNPRNIQGLLRIAEMYIDRKESGRALQILRAESKKNPDRLDLQRAIADMSAVAHDYGSAIAEYQSILAKVDPKLQFASEINGAIGEAYRANGQYELALKALQKAKEALPKDPAILSNLAVTLLHLGRYADAKLLYESTFNLQAENPIALNNLAYLIADKNGDLDSALTFAQRARQKWPHVYEISDTLAWIYVKKNLNDNAIEILAGIVEKRPDQPTFRYHLGAAWLQKGDKAKARKELETALGSRPSQEEIGRIKELLAKASS